MLHSDLVFQAVQKFQAVQSRQVDLGVQMDPSVLQVLESQQGLDCQVIHLVQFLHFFQECQQDQVLQWLQVDPETLMYLVGHLVHVHLL